MIQATAFKPRSSALPFPAAGLAATALVAGLSLAGWARAADAEDLSLRALQAYRLGQDPKPLTTIEGLVTAATRATDPSGRAHLAKRLAALLETNSTFECKQFVCRQLALIGGPQQVPILARVLADPELSDLARYALGPLPDPSASEALRAALVRTSGKQQIGIINTLGFRQDTQAVKSLGQLLQMADPEVARAAAAALGRIGGTASATLLRRALAKRTGDDHFWFADAFLACADTLLTQGKPAPAAAMYHQLTVSQESTRTRAAALRGLAKADERAATPLLLAALHDADPTMLAAGVSCIRLRRLPETSARLAAELSRLAPATQALVLTALADRQDAPTVPAILAATRQPDPALRVAAWRALGRIGDVSVVAPLIGVIAENSSGPEANAALSSLRELRGAAIDTAVVQGLPRLSAAAQVSLVKVLVDRNAIAAAPGLWSLLGEGRALDPLVAEALFRALGQLARPPDLPALLHLLGTTRPESVRSAAEEAVVALARKAPSGQTDTILAALKADKEPLTRCSLLRVLGSLGGSNAFAALQAALAGDSEPEVDTAVRILADWPGREALPVLQAQFQNQTNETRRVLALRGFVRLASEQTDRPPSEILEQLKQALGSVQQPDEKKLVLSGLASVSDAGALAVVEPYLEDSSVRDEAALAAVRIANAIAGGQRDLARKAIEKARAATQNAAVRQQADQVLQEIEKHEDFVRVWQVSEPYLESGKTGGQLFDVPFAPETAQGQSARWRLVTVAANPNQPAIANLLEILGGENRVSYLRTWIHSDQAQAARLELGSDDGVKAWLNGTLVHANNADRGLTVGEDHVPLQLQLGWNRLLLKVTQNGGGWAVCARLRKPDGGKLDQVRFDATHEGANSVGQ